MPGACQGRKSGHWGHLGLQGGGSGGGSQEGIRSLGGRWIHAPGCRAYEVHQEALLQLSPLDAGAGLIFTGVPSLRLTLCHQFENSNGKERPLELARLLLMTQRESCICEKEGPSHLPRALELSCGDTHWLRRHSWLLGALTGHLKVLAGG